jgi:uncharacterized protein (DUF2236 family)
VTVEASRFLDGLHALRTDAAYRRDGFFDPAGPFWKVSRESVVYLGGMRALLMQIAHPKVAQGVADHSRFRDDPFGRAIRTFHAVHAMVFGTREEALRTAAALRAVHAKVRGRLAEDVSMTSGPDYEANDPQLLFWVYATLVDSSLCAYQTFLPPLSADEQEQFYQESKTFARLMGIEPQFMPSHLSDFRRWLDEAIAGDTLAPTAASREVATALLKGSSYFVLLRPLNYVLAAGMLPPRLRERFELRWSVPVRAAFRAGVQLVRLLMRVTPRDWRALPAAKRAERRQAG